VSGSRSRWRRRQHDAAAQDKIAGMQARAGAIDELLASVPLPTSTRRSTTSRPARQGLGHVQVDNELAALKAEISTVRRPPSSLASKTPNWSRGPRRPPLTTLQLEVAPTDVRARNIENDRGLTARMFLTGLFLVVLYGAFIAVLWRSASPSV